MDEREIESIESYSKKHSKKIEKRRIKYQKFLSYGNGSDINYRGPLGTRGLKIIAWVLMACAASSLGFYTLINTSGNENGALVAYILLSYVGHLAIPCFMLAKFSTIIQKQKGHIEMVIGYLGIALLVEVAFVVAYFHYAVPLVQAISNTTFVEATNLLDGYFAMIMGKKLAFNVFIDMLMWALFFTFVDYKSDKLVGTKKIIFRSCSVLPFIYVCVCFGIKLAYAMGSMNIRPVFLPLLSTSSPIAFLAFILISLFLKNHKKNYMKIGGTEEGYNNYLQSKANSMHFSKLTAVVFIIVGIIDIIIKVIITLCVEQELATRLDTIAGLGDCVAYLVFSPVIMLFSYTRVYKKSSMDLVIALAGILLVIILALEGFFQTALVLINNLMSAFMG